MFNRTLVASTVTLLLSQSAFGQEASEEKKDATGAEASAETTETPAQPEASLPAEAEAAKKPSKIKALLAALERYTLGERDAALGDIRALVAECGDSALGKCTDRELGALYIGAGIIIASDSTQHSGSVAAFRKGLKFDSALAIPKVHRTNQVMAAFNEAKGEAPAPAPVTSAPEVQPAPAQPAPAPPVAVSTAAPSWNVDHDESNPGAYVFFSGSPMIGFGTGFASGPALFRSNAGLSILGAPGNSRTLVGARAHFGFNHNDVVTEGFLGASFVVGGLLSRPKQGNFGYITMATGFEHYPAVNAAVSTSQLRLRRKVGAATFTFATDAMWIPGAHFIFFGGEIGFGGGV